MTHNNSVAVHLYIYIFIIATKVRMASRFIAVLLLVLCLPLLAILFLGVWWKMGWPVWFAQVRTGQGGRPFRLWKFRSMHPPNDTQTGGHDTSTDAIRTPPFGAWLRRSGLDELPQLWNIACGDMAFVGPRPLLPRYDPYYSARERLRFRVRPGLTGLAQVSGRRALGWNERLEWDAVYVERVSSRLDLWILWRTLVWALQSRPPEQPIPDLDEQRRVPVQEIGHMPG